MNGTQILERERRWQRLAGFCAIAIVPLYIASTSLENSASVFDFTLPTERLTAADADSSQLLGAAALRSFAFLLYLPPLLYLFRAAQARSTRVSPAMIGFVFLGPILFAGWALISNIAQTEIAGDFVAQAARGGDIYSLLDDLADDSSLASIGSSLFFPAVLGVLVAMVYVPLQAMRVGLLTKFFATLGMAFGASLLLIAPQFSLLALALWFAWLGFTILARVPKGRPPAWDAGEAIPWPAPGQERQPDTASAGAGADVVDGDATELFGSEAEAKDQTARRERARKKKRKRRG